MRKYCKECGYKAYDNSNYWHFCPHCGNRLTVSDKNKEYDVYFRLDDYETHFSYTCTEKEFEIIDRFVEELNDHYPELYNMVTFFDYGKEV